MMTTRAPRRQTDGMTTPPPEPTPTPAPMPTPQPFVPAGAAPGGYPLQAPPSGPVTVVWHSRALLIGVIAFAGISALAIAIAAQGFPSNAPVEQIYAFGLIVDLIAVAIAVGSLLAVEVGRRRVPARWAAPVDRRFSVFAAVGAACALIAILAWAVFGGGEQLVFLLTAQNTRYMYHTGSLFLVGAAWVLGFVFGAWGVRSKGHPVSNALGIGALAVAVFLTAIAITATVVYGLGLSD